MTAQELFTYLTEDSGLDADTAAAITRAAQNPKVATKAAALKQQREYDELATRAETLRRSYEGSDGRPGARDYEAWYAQNFNQVMKLQQDVSKYQERFGSLDDPQPKPGQGQGQPQPRVDASLSEAAIAAAVNKVIAENYANQWSSLVTGAGTILERHMRAKREQPIDWAKLGAIAPQYGNDLTKAYDEYDRPNVEADREKEIQRRVDAGVKEKMAKANISSFFPSGADASPSSTGIARRENGSASVPAYNRNKVIESAVTGKYEGTEGSPN